MVLRTRAGKARASKMIWFTADTHFGHEKLVKNTHRPFANSFEMDNILVKNWNSVVNDDDIVYHLGDFCWINKTLAWEHYLAQLNGKIVLIKGNHDLRRNKISYLFEEVEYMKQVRWGKAQTYSLPLCYAALG